jgi:hypothetical protein
MKRHFDAIAISDGACNPRAIINSMARALADEELVAADTPTVCADPALKLMVHQLAFLMGIPTGEEMQDWADWRDACEFEAGTRV